ncbi:MAG: C10 family peptidase [Muribaculaceae bacterium]|nr:C10 family peptidase [Muribaculaceae bacterium]
MKKISQRLLVAAVVVAAGVTAQAEVLSPEQALSRALPQARHAAPGLAKPELVYTAEADELPAVYVFAKENKGFMVVSADDQATALLGYVDKGNFDAEKMAPGLKYWLGEYARQIAFARENGNGEAAPRMARAARTEIEPMLKTLWGQDTPYNNNAPSINGTKAPTGCVATAAAQVMKYHSYPAVGTGKFKYDAKVGSQTVELSIDVENTPLQWDLMLDTYTSGATAEQKDAVATLMQMIGYGVEMSYTLSGSGAQTWKVAKILAENFGYDKSIQYLARECYTQAEWEDMLYNQLKNVGPVLYDGTTINQEGHAFVFDGYQEDEEGNAFFHVNWGWDGMSNGYFAVGALDPSAMGTGGAASGLGFNFDQNATINAMPDKGGQPKPVVAAASSTPGQGLIMTPETLNLGREVTVGYEGGGFYSYTWYTLPAMKFGLHIVGEGQDFYRWGSVKTDLATLYGASSYGVLLSGVKENGTYTLTPVYKVGEVPEDGDTTGDDIINDQIYNMEIPYGGVRQYILKTSVHNATLEPVGVDVTVEDMKIFVKTGGDYNETYELKRNNAAKWEGTFVNNGEFYYYSHVIPAFFTKVYGDYEVFYEMPCFTLSLAPGETHVYEFEKRVTSTFGFVDGSDYYFGFYNPESNNIVSPLVKFHYGTVYGGIQDVEAGDDQPAEYYNLQGIRVAQPAAGQIYIVRRGDKTTKEFVK